LSELICAQQACLIIVCRSIVIADFDVRVRIVEFDAACSTDEAPYLIDAFFQEAVTVEFLMVDKGACLCVKVFNSVVGVKNAPILNLDIESAQNPS
jgi:hypothetical protein